VLFIVLDDTDPRSAGSRTAFPSARLSSSRRARRGGRLLLAGRDGLLPPLRDERNRDSARFVNPGLRLGRCRRGARLAAGAAPAAARLADVLEIESGERLYSTRVQLTLAY
jgi:hypothetical protein